MNTTVGIRRFVCVLGYAEDIQDLVEAAGVRVGRVAPGRLRRRMRVVA